MEHETHEKYFYGTEHWNYFSNDDDLGPVILSLKQENVNGRDQFRVLVRAVSYTIHGLIPASCVFADRYNREEASDPQVQTSCTNLGRVSSDSDHFTFDFGGLTVPG